MTRQIKISALFLTVLLGVSLTSHAQNGDAEAGKQKSATCAACHGPDGNSPVDQFPKIAGQVPGYIAASLAAYKSGERENAVMAGMVAGLSEQDMADLDAYYASQEMSPGYITEEQKPAALAAESIYRAGVAEYNVPACMGCHSPSGAGIPPTYPRLAGQYANYIETQMLAFKSGARAHDMMHPIAFPLSEEQIKQLSLYISALQ